MGTTSTSQAAHQIGQPEDVSSSHVVELQAQPNATEQISDYHGRTHMDPGLLVVFLEMQMGTLVCPGEEVSSAFRPSNVHERA